MTAWIVRIDAAWLRVPLWSLWFPLCRVPDFVLHMCWWTIADRTLEPLRHLCRAECWANLWCYYLIGLDGWSQYE